MINKHLLFLLLLVLTFPVVFANNIQIGGTGLVQDHAASQFAEIGFDISWENSWRDAANWDAAWVFMKYRETGNTGPWQHATLNYVNGTADGHTAPAGSTIETPPDGKGIFLYRSANGSGNVAFNLARIRWNYGVDGLANLNNVELQMFAIEMVQIPQGAFLVGDGQVIGSELYGNFEAGTTGLPFQITSENAFTLGGGGAGSLGNNNRINMFADGADPNIFPCSGQGCLNGSGDDFNDITSQTLPAAFPKGFNAFYCMKYEMTQQQFVDMLNCSTPAQQTFLAATGHFYSNTGTFAQNRYGIIQNAGIWTTTQPFLPMVYLDWTRAAAYADWSGLRPMTELEFEKACRGFDLPVVNEFAWGTPNADLSDDLTLYNMGLTDEGIFSGYDAGGINGNIWCQAGNQNMPYVARVGVFAADPANTGRITSGASVWGIMELSGNAWERAVSVGHPEGRNFDGTHGDGNLAADGRADLPTWPGTFGGGTVTSNTGVGYRGGALAYPTPNLERNGRVSSRRLASGYWNVVILDDGARFVRTIQ